MYISEATNGFFIMSLHTSFTDFTFNIKVIEKLTFDDFYNFNNFFQTAKSIGAEFVVDLNDTVHIDVSGLGMLLLLQEYVTNLKGSVSLILPNQANQANQANNMLKIAKFDKTFVIKSSNGKDKSLIQISEPSSVVSKRVVGKDISTLPSHRYSLLEDYKAH
ncbi:hypothetical protein [Colwellia piezophila]|uniref:hypothetical protein n=1 Tax=Colwellia piezophila TaxID=211668 RepID=UPI0006858766|nr:hypothetical protein [Colwellia piezophila]